MFYSVQLLAKKGPLGTVWIAGHLDKRLKRPQIYETNIASSVDSIINPEAPLALRLSGQLLLGVVRIYSRKITYLYSDCNQALVDIKQAFKAADVDLPNDSNIAPMHAITLPDNFNTLDFGFAGPNFLDMEDDAAPVTVSYGRRSSFVLADDLHDYFGSQRSIDEEQFEVGGEELQRNFSLDGGITPERLRAAPAGQQDQPQPLDQLFGESDRLSTGAPPEAEDELLAPPPDDMLLSMEGPTPLAPPSDAPTGASPARSLGLPALSDLGAMSTPGGSIRATPQETQEQQQHQHKNARGGRPPRPAKQGLKMSKRLRPVKQDMTSGGKANTELAKSEIMGLLKDPSSLIKVRSNASNRAHAQRLPDAFHVVHHSELAQESMLHWPAVSSSIAPQLYSLYSQAMSSGEEQAAAEAAGQGTPPHTHTREDATEQATAAVAMADEMAAAEAAEPETALEMIPPPTEMAEPPAEALDMGMAEPDLFQHQEGGAGMDAMMVDGEAEGLFAGTPGDHGAFSGSMATPPLTDAHSMPTDTSRVSELQSVGQDEHTKDSFTNRTKLVLNHLQTNFSTAPNGSAAKKRRLSSGAANQMPSQVSMNALVEGKGRRDASRWFFEMLVLKTRNYVKLEQSEPYADITIEATSKLLTMS